MKFNGSMIYLNSNVLTQFFYRQQFDRDFIEDAYGWLKDKQQFVGNRIAWALSKSFDLDLIDYDQWIQFFEGGETDWESIELEILKLFVTPKNTERTDTEVVNGYETRIIVSAVRSGISLELLKHLRPSELIDSINEPKVKKATQKDIDILLS